MQEPASLFLTTSVEKNTVAHFDYCIFLLVLSSSWWWLATKDLVKDLFASTKGFFAQRRLSGFDRHGPHVNEFLFLFHSDLINLEEC